MSEGDLAGTGSIDFTSFITMMSKKMKKVRLLVAGPLESSSAHLEGCELD